MVNEFDEPEQALENEQLSQRLVASNQALANMQAEHQQLLEEMEQLRKRAEDLQRLREQQEREEETKNTTQISESNGDQENVVKNIEEREEEDNEADLEESDYIKEKLAEIARLKAQFKRVQHMINTTELIENHISKNEATEKQLPNETNNPNAKLENKTKPKTVTAISTDNVKVPSPDLMNMPSMADLNSATSADEKEQLLSTMLNMFQDFSSDLKSQADNLRAERERIKELKESIIRSKKQPK